VTNSTASNSPVTVNVTTSAQVINNNTNNININQTEVNFLALPLIVNPNGTITIGLPTTLLNLINFLLG
jgi:hypothetical protein